MIIMAKGKDQFQEIIEKVIALLPQRNCGRCGFVDCHEYATALINQKASIDQCRRLSENSTREICRIKSNILIDKKSDLE
jgi:Na+-translocating ferredoxin:NAD+ oxidoreductase RNF subunit RnfB